MLYKIVDMILKVRQPNCLWLSNDWLMHGYMEDNTCTFRRIIFENVAQLYGLGGFMATQEVVVMDCHNKAEGY